MATHNYMTRSGKLLKRPPNLNLSNRPKEKRKRVNTSAAITMANQGTQDEAANLRAQLEAQRQEMEQARRLIENAQRQQAEMATIRDQMLGLQRERDEAHRLLNEVRQRQQPPAPGQNAQQQPQQNVSGQNVDICNIVSAMGISQLDYKIPKFANENESHPIEFLEKVEKFFTVKNINNEKKMALIEIALEGSARLWLNLQNSFNTYEAFKEAFKARFFSIPIQVKVKNQWSTREYNEKDDGNFQNYYYSQLKDASYIIPLMSEYEKNYVIVKQFPWWVQEALASANFEDPNSIAHTLANLDAIRLEKQIVRNNRQQNQPNNFKPNDHSNNMQTVRVRGIHTYKRRGNNFYSRQNYPNSNCSNYNSNSEYFNSDSRLNNNNSNLTNMFIPNSQTVCLPDTRVPPPNRLVGYNSNNTSINNNANNVNTQANTELNSLNSQATR